MKKFHGTGVALVTPFNADKSVDFKSLKKVVAHTSKGVDYLVVMGTTGESVTMNREEKKAVLDFVRSNNAKALPIVYGIGGNDTRHVLEELHATDLTGVDAILSVNPYYNKPSQEGIFQHFKAISGACPVPIILYNVPGRTSSNISAETTIRLAATKRVIGIKEASGNLEQCMKIVMESPKDFMLISGDDMLTVPLYSIGSVGVISVLANAFPLEFRKMKEFSMNGNYARASEAVFRLLAMNGPMYEEGSPAGVKYLLSLMGLCEPHLRLPHVEPSTGLKKKIETIYNAMKQGNK